jgi:GT2 family glycosyltransferase
VIYYDCEYAPDAGTSKLPFFKPDTLSPELLFSVNYITRAFIKRSPVNIQDIHPQEGHDLLAVEYELILHLVEAGRDFTHIPKVLVSQDRLPRAADSGNTHVILSHLSRIGRRQPGSEKIGNCVRFSWQANNPSIAIIIPTKNNPALLKNLVTSIFEKTVYKDFSINIVDNESDNKEVLAYYETLEYHPQCSIIPFHEKFNYSTAINLGVENTQSDLVLLLNDDMEVIDPHWLTEMAQWAMLPEVGVVGARLLRANRTLQHAGVIIGLNGFAGHIYLNAPEHHTGLFGSVDWYRDYLAVTGACQMVRRELFNSVNGYDRDFSLAFGDIDFCLKVYEKGYRNVYTPFANLYHHEGHSRGYATPIEDIHRGYQKMEDFLSKADPFYSPNLTYTRIPRCDLSGDAELSRQIQIEERKKFYLLKS